MMIPYECITCVVNTIVHMARLATDDEEKRRRIITLALNNLHDLDHTLTPPEQASLLHRVITDVLGPTDVYRDEKDRSTEAALALLPEMHELLDEHGNTFEAVVRLIIGGNIIDFGAMPHFRLEDVKDRLREVFAMHIDSEAVSELEEAMERASSIFYIADNCGEAVFDRLLVERYSDKITLGVRGMPVLNDITPREVPMSGLDFVPVVNTGDCTPGVSTRFSQPEFLDAMRRADLIISKGQGNFESLHEHDLPIFFLLRIKCEVISKMLGGAPLGSLQVVNNRKRRS